MNLRRVPAAVACFTILSFPTASQDRDGDPYRAFARSKQGTELLAEARDAIRGHWAPDTTPKRATTEIAWPDAPRGVYLSLTDATGTRACVGSVVPYRGNFVETVRALAVQSLQADRRHAPIRRDELPSLRIVISFAGATVPITDPMQVDPGREGLLVSSSGGSVAFLPGEARTVAWALREARRIGVIQGSSENVRYSRFPIVVLSEPLPKPIPVEELRESP